MNQSPRRSEFAFTHTLLRGGGIIYLTDRVRFTLVGRGLKDVDLGDWNGSNSKPLFLTVEPLTGL